MKLTSKIFTSTTNGWYYLVILTSTIMIYLATAWYILSPETFWSPDEGAKLLQLVNLRIEDRAFLFDIDYPGGQIDPNFTFALSEHPNDVLKVVDHQIQFERLPIFTLASQPLFRAMGYKGLYLIPILSGALIPIFASMLVPWEKRSILTWILIAFGSPIYIYSVLYWEHTLAVSLALSGALALSAAQNSAPRSPRSGVILAGISAVLLACSIYLRLEIALFAVALFSGHFLFGKNRYWTATAALLTVIILLPYSWLHAYFFPGEALPSNARYLYYPFAYLRHAQWRAIPDLLLGPPDEGGINTGWLGGLWALAAVIAVSHSFSRHPTRIMLAIKRLGLLVMTGVAAWFLFTPAAYRAAHGLLFTTPWAVLGFTRAKNVWDQDSDKDRILIFTYFAGLALYAILMVGFRASSPQGGLEWGARFALPFYPLIALIATRDLNKQASLDKILILSLFALGIGFQMRGISSIRQDKIIHKELNHTLAALPEREILTDIWWMFPMTVPIYPEKTIFTIADSQEMVEWATTLPFPPDHEFALVTFDPGLPAKATTQMPTGSLVIRELLQVDNLLIFRLKTP